MSINQPMKKGSEYLILAGGLDYTFFAGMLRRVFQTHLEHRADGPCTFIAIDYIIFFCNLHSVIVNRVQLRWQNALTAIQISWILSLF
jgi:hypothetical protein